MLQSVLISVTVYTLLELTIGCVNELAITKCRDLNEEEIAAYDRQCKDKDKSYSFHCQEDHETGSTRQCSLCAEPIQCYSGQHVRLVSEGNVRCEACQEGTYQPTPTLSTEFKVSMCDYRWQTCNQNEAFVCGNGTTSENRRCQCNWKLGYMPDDISKCSCFEGDNYCTCIKADCTLGTDYKCNSSTDPSTSTSSESITTNLTSTNPTHGLNGGVIAGIIIGIIVTVIISFIIVFMYFKKCRRRPNNPNSDIKGEETNIPLTD